MTLALAFLGVGTLLCAWLAIRPEKPDKNGGNG